MAKRLDTTEGRDADLKEGPFIPTKTYKWPKWPSGWSILPLMGGTGTALPSELGAQGPSLWAQRPKTVCTGGSTVLSSQNQLSQVRELLWMLHMLSLDGGHGVITTRKHPAFPASSSDSRGLLGLSYMCAKLLQSCPALCNPMDSGLPGSSVHRIL